MRKSDVTRTLVVVGVVLGLVACRPAAEAPATPAVELTTEEDKSLYAAGALLGRNFSQLEFSPEEVEVIKRGFGDAVQNKQPPMDLKVYTAKAQELIKSRVQRRAAGEKAQALAFQEEAAKEEGAERLPSGLIYRTVTEGSGPNPAASDTVSVHYHGTLRDGTVFDSSVERGQPAEFPLHGVIPCWREGVQRIKVGGKARLVCPSDIAYGDRGRPPKIPGGATLIFEVELLEIKGKG